LAGKTDYWSDELLDLLSEDSATLTPPAAYYVGLFTTAPTDAYTSGAPDGVEVDYGSTTVPAERQSVVFSSAETKGGTGRVVENSAAVEWTAWDVDTTVNVTHFGIFSAATAGELLYWAAVDTARRIQEGETASFAIDAITIRED